MMEILFMILFLASLSNGDEIFLATAPPILVAYIVYKLGGWKGHK